MTQTDRNVERLQRSNNVGCVTSISLQILDFERERWIAVDQLQLINAISIRWKFHTCSMKRCRCELKVDLKRMRWNLHQQKCCKFNHFIICSAKKKSVFKLRIRNETNSTLLVLNSFVAMCEENGLIKLDPKNVFGNYVIIIIDHLDKMNRLSKKK